MLWEWLRGIAEFLKLVKPEGSKTKRKVQVIDARGDLWESRKQANEAMKKKD